MLILALDTATNLSSLAIYQSGRVIAQTSNQTKAGHSGSLLTSIDALVNDAGIAKSDIDMVACGLGPGSFTGIRIGLATAKGLAAALNCSLRGVCTLDAIAAAAAPAKMPIMPIIDARKGEIFCANYDKDGQRTSQMVNIKPELITEYIKEPTILVGNGLIPYADKLRALLGDKFIAAPPELWDPQAGKIAQIAATLPADTPINPIYVRASDAQICLQG